MEGKDSIPGGKPAGLIAMSCPRLNTSFETIAPIVQ